MTNLLAAVWRISRFLQGVAGVSLVFLMMLTVMDVLLRAFRHPIPGTYELVGFAGALAIGMAMPLTSWMHAHVYVDTILGRLPRAGRIPFHVVTRLLGVGLFLLLSWNLARFGMDLRSSGEVSPTLELHYYPVAFGLALASLFQSIVLLCDLVKLSGGQYE